MYDMHPGYRDGDQELAAVVEAVMLVHDKVSKRLHVLCNNPMATAQVLSESRRVMEVYPGGAREVRDPRVLLESQEEEKHILTVHGWTVQGLEMEAVIAQSYGLE